MERTFEDQLGTTWTVVLDPVDEVSDDIEEEMTMRFLGDDDNDREIRVRGPVEERFEELTDNDLQVAVEAAGNALGFIFLHPDGHMWWVRRAEEDPLSDGARLTFSDLENELYYGGAIPSDLDRLSEDELQEIVDALRGATRP